MSILRNKPAPEIAPAGHRRIAPAGHRRIAPAGHQRIEGARFGVTVAARFDGPGLRPMAARLLRRWARRGLARARPNSSSRAAS